MSTIIANEIQVGQDSVTLTNNYVIALSSPPGNLTLSTGVSGNNTPVATIYANGAIGLDELLPASGQVTIPGNLVVGTIETTVGGFILNSVTANTVTINDYTFPESDGSANQLLQTDGAGNISFADPPAGFTTGKAIAMAIVFG